MKEINDNDRIRNTAFTSSRCIFHRNDCSVDSSIFVRKSLFRDEEDERDQRRVAFADSGFDRHNVFHDSNDFGIWYIQPKYLRDNEDSLHSDRSKDFIDRSTNLLHLCQHQPGRPEI